MPGFIGVRFGEMVSIPSASDYVDVYLWSGSTVWVGKVDNTIAARTDPAPGESILAVWSYDAINSVKACTTSDGVAFHMYVSSDSGHTWRLVLTSTNEADIQLRFDEIYGSALGALQRSVTGGTTWFDHIPLPAGRSSFGDKGASRTHIYMETNSGE